jgi:hypothetical protein
MIFVDIGEIVDHHKITPLFNSISDGQQFHYQQKSPLTSTH